MDLKELKKRIKWKHIIIILVVMAIGLFIFNQLLALSYKYVLLTTPCDLCDAYIKHQSNTFDINWSALVVQNLTIQ